MLASNRGFKGSSIGPSMLVRRLCSSLIRSDARLPRHHQLSCNSASFPDLLLPFARSGSLKSGFPRSGPVTKRCVRPYSQMSGARWPPAVPLPPLETAGRAEVFRALEASLGRSFNSQPLAPSPNPLIIVISGPSGVGKDAVIKKLREVREGIDFVVTATSRARRPGEVDGKDYHFVSKEKFLSMVENEELLEYALVYGEYKGIPKQQVRECMAKGLDIVLRVDIQGAATLRSVFGGSAVFIFLVAESEAELVERLIDRKTETKETLLVRVNTAREELKHLDQFDYAVVNAKGELESAVKLVESIIDAEKAKVLQRAAVV